MAFVNEIVSETDIQRYGLDELIRKFRPFAWREGRPSTFVHAWTVDRDRDAFFIPVKTIEEVGPSGRPEPTNKRIFILNWKGRTIRFTLNRAAGSSTDLRDVPFRIVWELEEFDMSPVHDASRDEVLSVLKDALRAYGHFGAHDQVTGTAVEFNF